MVALEDIAHAEGVTTAKGVDACSGVELETYTACQTIIEFVAYWQIAESPSVIFNHKGDFWTKIEIETKHFLAKGEMGKQWQLDVIPLTSLIVGGGEPSLLIIELDPQTEITFEYHTILQSCRYPYRQSAHGE